MECPKCGRTLRESAKFCSWCGEKIENPPAENLKEITLESIMEEAASIFRKNSVRAEKISEHTPESITEETAPPRFRPESSKEVIINY